MVGDEPHIDITFGNMNNMATIWVTKIENFYAVS